MGHGYENGTARVSCIAVFLATVFVVLMSSGLLKASPLPSEADRPFFERIQEQARTGVHGPFGDHYYWEDGFHLVSPKKRVRIRLDGRLMVDGGYIGADKALQDAFPDLEGGEAGFRDLRVILTGIAYDDIYFKFDLDFASVGDIKDIWIAYSKIPFIGEIKAGHFREPISLERLTSLRDITFMERATSTSYLLQFRTGFLYENYNIWKNRIGLQLAYTANGTEFASIDYQLTEGQNLSTRITINAVENEPKNELLHLGLSFTHKKPVKINDNPSRVYIIAMRPESNLARVSLFNEFTDVSTVLIGGLEAAYSIGSFCYQICCL